ncbi:hypothetical protein AVEN_73208-1 [Araneus ventricosus]|uniref:Uncharacterized protein n=1 Tax=Araneus ventricosus TaxID=182803 RepID=A0A4Y2HMT5_ARAVE|nr:hypothetical protein AVEN_73208-1 [Araneus ventricosus]
MLDSLFIQLNISGYLFSRGGTMPGQTGQLPMIPKSFAEVAAMRVCEERKGLIDTRAMEKFPLSYWYSLRVSLIMPLRPVALGTFLTLPVTVVAGKKSFSKLTKTYF